MLILGWNVVIKGYVIEIQGMYVYTLYNFVYVYTYLFTFSSPITTITTTTTTSLCECFAGYEGMACQRQECPNDCNGR